MEKAQVDVVEMEKANNKCYVVYRVIEATSWKVTLEVGTFSDERSAKRHMAESNALVSIFMSSRTKIYDEIVGLGDFLAALMDLKEIGHCVVEKNISGNVIVPEKSLLLS